MTKARADEIVRSTFYRHLDNLASAFSRDCDNTEIAFYVARYVGMMQKDLETELSKEINVEVMKNEVD